MTVAGSGLPSHRNKIEFCLVLDKCSQRPGKVMLAAKEGVHRGLLVTGVGYQLLFNGPTKRKKTLMLFPSPTLTSVTLVCDHLCSSSVCYGVMQKDG